MQPSQTQLKAKLIAMVVSFLTIIVILASMFYLSTERFNYHMERNKLAQDVLTGYLAISNHSYQKFNAMGEIVAEGEVEDIEARYSNEQSLLDALGSVRQSIAKEVAFVTDEDESDELNLLAEVERIAERIIQGSANIRQFVKSGDRLNAQRELSVLRSAEVAGQFSDLIDLALEGEYREVEETEAEAAELMAIIKTGLPITITLVVICGFLITVFFSRRLTRSVTALNQAAAAYASGDLEHRTQFLFDSEFSSLGQAFNQMAQELTVRRKLAEQSQEVLETQVQTRTQELEELNSRLESLDRSRRQFLADISHELRTPLTVIQGESEMALRGDAKSSEEYQDALTRIREQTLHTTRLVEDLLFVARAEDGKARIDKSSVAVARVLRTVCRDLQSVAARKRVEIKEFYADQHAVVFGDEGRLRQVFTILLDNAIRYSNSEGKVSVRLALATDNDMVEFSFEDEGIGLTEEEARQAFFRFYRGDNAERHARGSGLGLPVAKAIVEAHQGQISLTGKPGEGAKATVRLKFENRLKVIA